MSWKFTDEHKQHVPAWNAETLAIIESTDDYDYKECIPLLTQLYKAVGLNDDIEVYYSDSVFDGAGMLAAETYRRLYAENTLPEVGHPEYKNDDYNPIRNAVKKYGEKLAEEIGVSFEDMWPVLRVIAKECNCFLDTGSEGANYPRYMAFVRDICNFDCPEFEQFQWYEKLIKYGPRYVHNDFVIMCGKVKSRQVNYRNQLHNETGPAVEWRCGHKIWALDGVELTQQIVEFPESLKIEQIQNERDNDVKRIMLERFGLARYIDEAKLKMVDERQCFISNTMEQLYTDNDVNYLAAVDPSGAGIVVLPVPLTENTCEKAQQWLDPSPTGGTFLFRT